MSETLQLDRGAGEAGHWVTIDGRPVFIRESAGHVPKRLQAGDAEKKRFTKAALERHLIDYHNAVTGGGSYTAADERKLNEAAGAGDPFTFKGKLPTEIRRHVEGRPELRSLFHVTQDARKAGGADAFAELGDEYLDVAERKAGSPLRAAKETAHNSNDPEVRFLAHVHDNLPAAKDRAAVEPLKAGQLRVGNEFTVNGERFRVAEDEHGNRVLRSEEYAEDVPVDALRTVPADEGSFRRGRRTAAEAIPFGREVAYLSVDRQQAVTPADAPAGLPTHVRAVVGGEEREYPVSYWWKDAIEAGHYVHPKTGRPLTVDEARIDRWVDTFKRMRAVGVEIPAPAGHTEDPAKNLGYVVDARREGGRLKLLTQAIGEDAALVAARNQCSLYIDGDYTDARGTRWGDCFLHSAFTSMPVVSGQGPFVPATFAASRGQAEGVPVYHLSASPRSKLMDLKQLRERLGAADDVTDERVIELAAAALDGHKADAVKAKASESAALSRAAAAESRVTELSRSLPPAADPDLLADRAELVLGRIDLAVERGDLPKPIAERLAAAVKPDGKPSAFMLSRQPGFDARPVEFVLNLFDGAKLAPRAGDSRTGVQELSRVPWAGIAKAAGAAAEAGDDALAKAGREQAEKFAKERLAAQGKN